MSDKINDINSLIVETINDGKYSVAIDLSLLDSNTSGVIIIPPLLESISFDGSKTRNEYIFAIEVDSENIRTKDLEIVMKNVHASSTEHSFINLAGNFYSKYITTIKYSDDNVVKSKNHIGICVSFGKTVEIVGDNKGVLEVYGGNTQSIAYCAIGNNENVYPEGGHIIFSGEGIVKGYGGTISTPAIKSGVAGGFAIGFEDSTTDSNSILIKCNVQVEAYGGQGQPTSDILGIVNAGDGGAGISLGVNGVLMIEDCSKVDSSLTALGGNGGTISLDDGQMDIAYGGTGGSGISINSGTITIDGRVTVTGGDGTGINNSMDDGKPIQGGDGGSSIEFSNSLTNLGPTQNTVKLGSYVELNGGNGSNSGVQADYDNLVVSGITGGNGGSTISTSERKTIIILASVNSNSGNGGNGGNTNIYYDPSSWIDGIDKPGAGGENGANIKGGLISLNYTGTPSLNSGNVGNGGIGVTQEGTDIQGEQGKKVEIIDAIIESSPHFGLINLESYMNLMSKSQSQEQSIRGMFEKSNIPIVVKEGAISQYSNLNLSRVFFDQIFDFYLNIDFVNIKYNYNSNNAGFLTGNTVLSLEINSILTAYQKRGISIYTKLPHI